MEVLFSLLVKLFALVLVHGQETGITLSTDAEWIDIGTQTVYYIEKHEAASWFTAWDNCALKVPGGRLAKFETMNQMLLLRSYLKDIPESLWIGLHYVDRGPFVWTDNSLPAFNNWEKGEPVNILHRECVQINATTMAWKNGPTCYSEQLYICASDKVGEWIDTDPETSYYIERHLKTTWAEASSICSSWEHLGRKGRLANFETKDEMLLLHSHLKDMTEVLWIGLRSYWRDSSFFAWTDDRLPAFTNWDEGEPNNKVLKDCVELNATTMAWNDEPCNSKRLFICVFDKRTKSKSVSVKLQDCGPNLKDWKLFQNNCYLLRASYEDALDWMSSEQYCVNRKAHLVSVMDQKEEDFIFKGFVTESEAMHTIWSGLKLVGSGSASKWSDGTVLNYTKFNEQPSSEGCVSFNLLLGEWKAHHCSRKLGLICKASYPAFHTIAQDIHNCSGSGENDRRIVVTDSKSGDNVAGIAVDIVISLLILSILVYLLVKRAAAHSTLSSWIQNKITWRKNNHLEDSVSMIS